MKLSVIMPAYNEEATIEKIINIVLDELTNLKIINDYEIIVIEDCSTDNTLEILNKSFSENCHVHIFSQCENQGKGAAISSGFQKATGEIILIQDADLEYDPKDYTKLISPIIASKADVVYGTRFKGETVRVLYFWHAVGNQFLTTLSNMFTNLNLTDMETCYKVFKAEVIKPMVLVSKRFGIEPEITAKISKCNELKIYEVPISYYGRTYNEGKKIGWKDGFSAIWSIVRFNLFWNYKKSFNKINLK